MPDSQHAAPQSARFHARPATSSVTRVCTWDVAKPTGMGAVSALVSRFALARGAIFLPPDDTPASHIIWRGVVSRTDGVVDATPIERGSQYLCRPCAPFHPVIDPPRSGEKFGGMRLLGRPPDLAAKAKGDKSMVGKRERLEDAYGRGSRDPRDTVKGGLPELQPPAMQHSSPAARLRRGLCWLIIYPRPPMDNEPAQRGSGRSPTRALAGWPHARAAQTEQGAQAPRPLADPCGCGARVLARLDRALRQ